MKAAGYFALPFRFYGQVTLLRSGASARYGRAPHRVERSVTKTAKF
jgi:hypothetical protein